MRPASSILDGLRRKPGRLRPRPCAARASGSSGQVLALDQEWARGSTGAEQKRAQAIAPQRKSVRSKAKGGDVSALLREGAEIKNTQGLFEERAAGLRGEIEALLAGFPNLPADDVPDGHDESENQIVRQVGTPPRFDFRAPGSCRLGRASLPDGLRARRQTFGRAVSSSSGLGATGTRVGAIHARPPYARIGYRE